MITLRSHNILDYFGAAILILSPRLLGFSNIDVASTVFLILGCFLAIYSLLTKYYYCLARVIPIGVHMTLDVLIGFVVILSPYLFNYRAQISNTQFAWHVLIGLLLNGLVFLTFPRTEQFKTLEQNKETTGHRKVPHSRPTA